MKNALHYTLWILISIAIGMAVPYGFIKIVKLPSKYLGELNKPVIYKNSNGESYFIGSDRHNEEGISIALAGDIMMNRAVAKSADENFGGNLSLFFKNTDFIKTADIAFANLEGPISDQGKKSGSIYSFRMRPNTTKALADAGFDILSVANNHIGDWGAEAAEDTIESLRKENILAAGWQTGDEETTVKIIETNGFKTGFLAFSDLGPNWIKADKGKSGILIVDSSYENRISSASKTADALVVSLHFGDEYKKEPSKRQEELARKAINSGAKIVVGHHPHVVQKIERYKEGLIAYSLGNFIFDQNFSEETMKGLVLIVKISPDGAIRTIEEKNIKLNKFFQPEISDEL